MHDQELLNLYAADQAERKMYARLANQTEKESMKLRLQINDKQRRELVAELMPLNGLRKRDVHDYYYAATIYSRGQTHKEHQVAHAYAKKAFSMIEFRRDDFSEKVRDLYKRTEKKLNKNTPQKQLTQQNTSRNPLQIQPNGPAKRSQQQEEELRQKELEKQLRRIPLCCVCGRKHQGPCAPR